MWRSIKLFYWDMRKTKIVDEYKYFFIRGVAGMLGMHLRKQYWRKRVKSSGENLNIHENFVLKHSEKLTLGKNVSIGANVMIDAGGEVYIGDYVLIAPNSMIWSVNHIITDLERPINHQGLEGKKTFIGNDVWLGANTFVMPGAIIGDKCVVAAHSVVAAKKYKEGLILAGNPARKIGER